jgi:HK97 family phage major capsid protein
MTAVMEAKELKVQLKAKLDENDRIIDAVKVGQEATGDATGIVITGEQRDLFRKNLADAAELKDLIDGLESHAEMKAYLDAPAAGSAAVDAATQQQLLVAGGQGLLVPQQAKSLAERFTESEEFKALIASGGATMPTPWEVNERDLAGYGQKDVYTALAPTVTNRGFGTSQRDPIIPLRQRTARVRDLFPVATTSANLIDYYRVSGFTNNAAPVRERAAANGIDAGNVVFGLKPQSALAFTVAQAPVRTIAHFEVAHRNVLADEPQLQATINNELMYGLRLVEDQQILSGDGLGENLLGILVTPGIQTYDQTDDGAVPAVPTESKADALRRSATRVLLAYYEPTGFVLHPYDWEDIELTKDTTGQYVIVSNVAIGAEARLWRQPVIDTPAMPEGTWLTGAFGLGAQLYDREQANIRIAEQHADFFIRNAIAILAEERLALATKRPESFVKGTFVPE